MKRQIKLSESDLKDMVKEIVENVMTENGEVIDEGFWDNVGNAVKTGFNNQGNMPGDNLSAGWNKFKQLQATMQQLKQEIQQKKDEYAELQQELISMNGQNSRNMAGVKRGMGAERYGNARDAYRGGMDANQYDRQYGEG